MSLEEITYNHVAWINIVRPTADDVEAVRRRFPYIHPLNLEDVRSPIERPKIDADDDYLFTVLHFPLWDPVLRLSRASEVDLFLGRGYVISIHDGTLKTLNRLRGTVAEDAEARQRLLGRGANHVFYTIIDQLVDYIFPILTKVDTNIQQIEESIFTANTRAVIQDIAIVRRDVIALRRIIRQQVPIIEDLEAGDHIILHEDLEEYFGDIADHVRKARDIVDEDYEIIVGLAETADTLATYRINEIIRILTVISVIMLPLTLISSIYGMNVELPFGKHPYAFIIVALLMIVIIIFMLVYFRRRNWL